MLPRRRIGPTAAVDTKNDFYTIFEGGDCCGVGPIEFPKRSKSYSFVNYGLGASGPITFDKARDLVVAAYDRQKGPYVRVITPTGQSEFQTSFKASRMTFDQADYLLYIGKGAEIEIIDFATKKVVGAINGVTSMRGMAIDPNPY